MGWGRLACVLALWAACYASGQVVEFESGGLKYQTLTRDGVTITFARDVRGKASICVTGTDYTEEDLRALGEEMGQRVVQQYVYQRLKDEIQTRRFVVVQDSVDESHAIHLKVRHWDG